MFFLLMVGDVEVILRKEQAFPQEILEEKDVAKTIKFWLKFVAGHGTNKNNSVLAIGLPTCTAIASKILYKQIKDTWQGNGLMDTIPLVLPKGPDETTTTTAAATTPKGILRTASTVATNTNNNKSGQQDMVKTTTSTVVEGYNVEFATGTATTNRPSGASGRAPADNPNDITAGKELAKAKPFQF